MSSYLAPGATLQQLLQRHARADCKNAHVQKVLQRIKTCRTAALGYHLYRCSDEQCGHTQYQYHSCRDRHCPNCGAVKKQQWIEARTRELLPVKYYHVVFTVPHVRVDAVREQDAVVIRVLDDGPGIPPDDLPRTPSGRRVR